jgi:hypothetical protein
VVLVHHASKRHHAHPGQALRGSGDLHAFGDDNAYLAHAGDHVVLTLEHRHARTPDPVALRLVSRPDGSATHLEPITAPPAAQAQALGLADAVVELLGEASGPLARNTLRARLKVNNQRLGDALGQLERQRRVLRSSGGWKLAATPPPRAGPPVLEQLALAMVEASSPLPAGSAQKPPEP